MFGLKLRFLMYAAVLLPIATQAAPTVEMRRPTNIASTAKPTTAAAQGECHLAKMEELPAWILKLLKHIPHGDHDGGVIRPPAIG